MKKLLLLCSLAAGAFMGAASTANADCDYGRRYVRYYEPPCYEYRPHYESRVVVYDGYPRYYAPPVAYCPPPVHVFHHRPRFSFSFGF